MWMQSEHPLLEKFKEVFFVHSLCQDGGLCEMLGEEDGKAVCMIEKYLGREWKPEPCRAYPENGGKCRRELQGLPERKGGVNGLKQFAQVD